MYRKSHEHGRPSFDQTDFDLKDYKCQIDNRSGKCFYNGKSIGFKLYSLTLKSSEHFVYLVSFTVLQ